jgi:hypothetical protein
VTTGADDLEAEVEEATRRLTEGAAAEATDRLVQACAAGSAAAAERLAAIEAVGAGRPQSWPRALDFLELAAARGLKSARGQLALLAGSCVLGAEAEAPEPFAEDLWRRLRGEVDIAALTAAKPKRSLREAPRIRAFDGFATEAECRWIMAKGEGRLRPARVWDPVTGENRADPSRTNHAMDPTWWWKRCARGSRPRPTFPCPCSRPRN